MTMIVPKPKEIFFYPIDLDPIIRYSTPLTFQEKYYQPQHYFIEKNQDSEEYYLRNSSLSLFSPESTAEYTVHAFVIIEKEHTLELAIGDCNHYIIAKRALSVVAAGDIYVLSKSKKIFKITDQAGSYHIQANDLLACEKSQSAQAALKAVGLPLHLFVPFQKSKTLIFQDKQTKEKAPHTHSLEKLKVF